MREFKLNLKWDKVCLTNVITFYSETAAWMDEGRAVDIVHLDSSKVFYTVFHNTLLGKLGMCRWDKWAVR